MLLLLLGSSRLLSSLGSGGGSLALLLLLLDVLSGLLDGLLDLGLLLFVVVRLFGFLLGLGGLLLGRQGFHTLRPVITDSLGLDEVRLIDIPVRELAHEAFAAARVVGIALLILHSALFDADLLEADVELDSSAALGLKLIGGRRGGA